ncbi:MAG: glycosyltransferase [Candidatus Omnitrophota bacterium]|nr:MAG: glycosyltransferase [Candidatus Omnitrophota bacterium]
MIKILILYATAGVGHKKAAFAIKEAFDKTGRKDVLLKDSLDYTNRFFKPSYNSIYLALVKYFPTLWGFFYYVLDNPWIYALTRPIRRLTNHINSKKLVKFLLTVRPETIIVTHFFASEVIAHLKKKGILKDSRLITVITDYKSHTFWLSKYVDCYIVGSEYTRDDLIRRGILPERIKPLGIPCAKSFSEKRNREKIKTEIGLKPDKRTIFILGGGFGVGPIKKIVLHLDKTQEDFQGIVVCGYNKKLYNTLVKIAGSAKHVFKIYGFVDNVDELMAASDILISKSGGITVTEALNAALPMVVIDPIPGQEMRNYRFLEKHTAALKIKTPKDIAGVMKELLGSNKLDILKNNISKIRLIDSAERIVDEVSKR